MPQKDRIHEVVKNALIKDGWTITADPFILVYEGIRVYADLSAEQTFAAERAGRKIVVEIKSFLSPSPLHDFQQALGQYTVYRDLLELTDLDYQPYLAITHEVYRRVFSQKAIRTLCDKNRLALLVVDSEKEEVLQWIE